MSFNVCPFDPKAASLAPFQTAGKRIPLAERAARAARERSISLEQARAHCHLDEFDLGGNHFQIIRMEKHIAAELISLAISHLGSAFKDRTIGLYFSRSRNNFYYVIVKVAPSGIKFSSSLYGPASTLIPRFFNPGLLNLEFSISSNNVGLDHIAVKSRGQGQGGKALAALYNIARELGISFITYFVQEQNVAAKRFYFHLDFGAPTNPRCTEWEVKVAR